MKRSRYALPMFLGLLVLCGALYYSIRHNPDWQKFDSKVFIQTLSGLDWGWLAASVGAIYATYFLRALRWRVLIRPLKRDPSVLGLWSATVIGFGAIGIMGRAGELVRPYLIARRENLPVSSQLATWVLERSFDTLILLAAVGFAAGKIDLASLRDRPETVQWIQTAGHAVGLSTASLILLLVLLRGYYDHLAEWLMARLAFLSKARRQALGRFLDVFGRGLHSMRDTGSMVLCLVLTLIQWLFIAGSYHAVLASSPSGPDLTFSQTLIFMGTVMAGSIVQIPGIGGGMQITTVLALTEIFGVTVEVASGMALVIWVLTFLAVVPPALVLLAWNGLSWSKLRQLESEA
jgi:glycosyltransferase 2 family protein